MLGRVTAAAASCRLPTARSASFGLATARSCSWVVPTVLAASPNADQPVPAIETNSAISATAKAALGRRLGARRSGRTLDLDRIDRAFDRDGGHGTALCREGIRAADGCGRTASRDRKG